MPRSRVSLCWRDWSVAGFLVKATGLSALLEKEWLDTLVRGGGYADKILFLAVGGLWTAVGLPRQAASFGAGYAFGFGAGLVLGVFATMLGCVGAFYYARLLGRDFVAARLSAKTRQIDAFLNDNSFTTTLLIRFLPVGSNLVTNLVAGISSVPALAFFAGSALGYIPQTAIFALAGSGVEVDPALRIGLAAVLLLISGVMSVALFRRFRNRHGAENNEEDRSLTATARLPEDF